jgi:hypothetical protein
MSSVGIRDLELHCVSGSQRCSYYATLRMLAQFPARIIAETGQKNLLSCLMLFRDFQ